MTGERHFNKTNKCIWYRTICSNTYFSEVSMLFHHKTKHSLLATQPSSKAVGVVRLALKVMFVSFFFGGVFVNT